MAEKPLPFKPGDTLILATKPGHCGPLDPSYFAPQRVTVDSVNNRSIRLAEHPHRLFNASTILERNAYAYPLQLFGSMDEYLSEKNCIILNQKIKQHIAFNPLSYQDACAIAKILDIST